MADKKGTTFAVIEEENKDNDLPTFEDYLRKEGMISINVQNDTLGFTGETVAEYGVVCAEMNEVSTPPLPSTIPVIEGEENPILIELPTDRFTLDWLKCYLDICATYHTFFIEEFLANVHKGDTTLLA